jgi:hypothetical protein
MCYSTLTTTKKECKGLRDKQRKNEENRLKQLKNIQVLKNDVKHEL